MIKISNSVLYMIGEIIPKIISVLLLPVYTRYFSPEDYGVMSYIDSLIVFVLILSVLSLNSYVLRNYFELNDLIKQKKLIGNIFLFISTYSIFTFFFFSFFIYILLELLNSEINFFPLVLLALIANFFETFSIIPLVLLRLKERVDQFIFYSLSKTVLQVILLLLFVIHLDYGIEGKYYGLILANFIFALIYIKMMLQESILNLNIQQIKSALKFSLPLIPGAISFIILDISDRIILEKYVTLQELGLYSIAYTLGFGINVIITSSYMAFEPKLFKTFHHKDFLEIFTRIKNNFFALIFFIALVFILFSQELLLVMATDKYYNASYIVPVIVLAAIAKAMYLLYAVLAMYGKNTKLISLAIIIGAFVNLVINLIFIPLYGVIIAALSTVVSFILISIIVQVISYKYFKLSLQNYLKDYLLLAVFAVFIYVLFYTMNIGYSIEDLILKVVILIISTFLIKKYYKIELGEFIKNV